MFTWPPSPATIAIAWPVLTAIASLAYRYAEAQPRLHGFLSTLASLGVDLPKLWDALGRLLTGSLPPSTAAAKAATVKLIGAAILLAGISLGCQSCVNGQPPPVLVPSVNLAVCVFDQYATAPACRPTGNWVACVGGIAQSCGADVASIEQVLAAHRKAMIADGFVLPPNDAGAQ